MAAKPNEKRSLPNMVEFAAGSTAIQKATQEEHVGPLEAFICEGDIEPLICILQNAITRMICSSGDGNAADDIVVLNTGTDDLKVGDTVQWQPSGKEEKDASRPRRTYNLFAIEDWKEATFRTLVYMELLRLAKAETGRLSVEVLVEQALPGPQRKRADIMLKAWSIATMTTEREWKVQHLLGVSVLELKCSGLADLSRRCYTKRMHRPDYAFPGIFKWWKAYQDLSYEEKVNTWFPAARHAFLDNVPDATKIRLFVQGPERTASSATVQELMQKTCDEQLINYAELATRTHYGPTYHAVLHLMFSHIFHQTVCYTRMSTFKINKTGTPIHTATTITIPSTKMEAEARIYDAVSVEWEVEVDPRTGVPKRILTGLTRIQLEDLHENSCEATRVSTTTVKTSAGAEAEIEETTPSKDSNDTDETDSLTGHIQNLALVQAEAEAEMEKGKVEEESDC